MSKHKIIDAHSHLGDIFAYERNVIYKGDVEISPDKYDPFAAFSEKGFTGPFLDPNNPDEIANVIDMTAEVSYANTLSKLQKDLDEAGIDHVCMFPIAPYINFEDYRVVSLVEPRIIPFTSVDWSKDAETAKKQLLEDYKNGAKGIKIHPIIQKVSLRDPKVEEVLEVWAETGLPVVSHCGMNSYYPEGEYSHTEAPENGNLDDFMYLVKEMPQINFISAHAGGLNGGEMEILAENLAGAPNLWVDTTFRSAEEMKQMVSLFGEDRVLFGVDRPFGKSDCSVKAAFDAFGEYTPLSEKVMYQNAADLLQLEQKLD